MKTADREPRLILDPATGRYHIHFMPKQRRPDADAYRGCDEALEALARRAEEPDDDR